MLELFGHPYFIKYSPLTRGRRFGSTALPLLFGVPTLGSDAGLQGPGLAPDGVSELQPCRKPA